MPVYEIVLREPGAPHRISFSTLVVTGLGDLLLVEGEQWIVIEKEPPFELRKIERRICSTAPLAGASLGARSRVVRINR